MENNNMTFRRYPIGIQTFSRIIEEGYVYVDKTDLVWKMAHASPPGIMEVDYVRLYKPRTDYNTVLNMNNYNFSNHDNRVKKKIKMSGTNELQTTDNVYLRATDGVEITGDFTVPVGAELYIDVNSAY